MRGFRMAVAAPEAVLGEEEGAIVRGAGDWARRCGGDKGRWKMEEGRGVGER